MSCALAKGKWSFGQTQSHAEMGTSRIKVPLGLGSSSISTAGFTDVVG